ncbi:hypothetical protein DER29_0684 [Micromonospora sp. M71_S20]|nr:hypothetical protein DER29_0684 [Micromonospora sp. M71_S20]
MRRDDERFLQHGSHRWTPPDPDDDQEAWGEMVRQHQRQYLDEMSARRKPRRGRETPWASASIMGR